MHSFIGLKPFSLWRMTIAGGVLAIAMLALIPSQVGAVTQQAWVLKLSGSIGPASSDYIGRALDEAAEADARLLIIEMDTPGGLSRSICLRVLSGCGSYR